METIGAGCTTRWADLPDGAFVLLDGTPALVLGGELIEWTHHGYGLHRRQPKRGTATVITPPTTVAALRAGYRAQIHGGG